VQQRSSALGLGGRSQYLESFPRILRLQFRRLGLAECEQALGKLETRASPLERCVAAVEEVRGVLEVTLCANVVARGHRD
jgi:hypothetical protein